MVEAGRLLPLHMVEMAGVRTGERVIFSAQCVD